MVKRKQKLLHLGDLFMDKISYFFILNFQNFYKDALSSS